MKKKCLIKKIRSNLDRIKGGKNTISSLKYYITVKSPDGVSKGVKYLQINGKSIRGNIVSYNKEDKEVEVTVILGNN